MATCSDGSWRPPLHVICLIPLLALVLWASVAQGAPRVVLTAEVRPDLQTITGELRVFDGQGIRLVDALSMLPVPDDDLLLRRTFPGPVESGWVHMEPVGDDRTVFHTIVPRRADASGMVPGRGLFLNGLWHPQPVRGDEVPVVDWEVAVQLPPGATGVLNGTVGHDLLVWSGRADRLALAVLPHGKVKSLPLEAGTLTLVDQGPARPRRDERVAAVLGEAWPGPGLPRIVVVETPSRRRLTRAGPGVLFLSDRAFRVTDGLWRYHVPSVRRGLLEAGLPVEDPWQRAVAAAALAEPLEGDPDPRQLLGWVAWIPEVDELLYDGQLPFFSDVFDETWPADPVADDLLEMLDPRTPGRALVRRIDTRYGPGVSRRLSWRLLQGEDFLTAAAAAGVPPWEIEAWKRLAAPEDLSVVVTSTPEGAEVVVARQAEPDTPGEPVVVEIDGTRQTWDAGVGPGRMEWTLPERPGSVWVDPDGNVRQVDRANDRWPRRWTTVASFFPYELSLRSGRISAAATLGLRRQYDSRWVYFASVETNPYDLVAADVMVLRYLGPLQTRRTRAFRLWAGGGPALLDPTFRSTADGSLAIGGYVGGAWDTRVDTVFPRRGHRLAVDASGGVVPGGDQWGAVGIGGVLLRPVSGRVVAAGRVAAGLAEGGVQHRLLRLGGSASVQGIPPDAVVGDRKVSAGAELRWQVVRQASLPLPLVWLSDVQVSAGLDGGVLGAGSGADTTTWSALGWNAGLAFTGDVFGARPTLLGLWAGHLLWWSPADLVSDPWPQFYLRLTQPF